jgi:transcriptional regulator with XRE-family HTH domain
VAAETPERLVQRVGRRISEIRRLSGMTQETFAEALEVSVQYASRIETGENLTLHTLAKVARALHVEVIELFEPAQPVERRPSRGRPRKSASKT